MHAIFVSEYGGPEVMAWTEFPDPVPGAGEVLVRLGVAGVNFMDTGARTSQLTGWSMPTVLGVEGMGYVTALGDGVRDLAVGDRVAWVYHRGSYAEQLAIPADALVKVPDDIDDDTAAAVMMQGLTAGMVGARCRAQQHRGRVDLVLAQREAVQREEAMQPGTGDPPVPVGHPRQQGQLDGHRISLDSRRRLILFPHGLLRNQEPDATGMMYVPGCVAPS